MKRLFLFLLLLLTLANFSTIVQAEDSAAKELSPALGFEQDAHWLNVSRPLTIEELRGKVVILDFWTYGCINCIHVLEDLDYLQNKYANQIAIIGVHSPKFDNEKNLDTLQRIIARYGIEHPVISDNNFKFATRYGMRAWPTQFVITPQGRVLGKISGEGNVELFEEIIDNLLEEQTEAVNLEPLPIALEKDKLSASFLAFPGKIAVSDQYVAISDTLHHRIVITDHDGKVAQIIGGDTGGFSDGDHDTARFLLPQGLAFLGDTLYVADTGNHSIRSIDLSGGAVTTVAGTGKVAFHIRQNKRASKTALRSPWDIAVWNKRLIIAMAGDHQLWELKLKQNKIKLFSGNGKESIDDGTLLKASYSQPSGLSLFKDKLYVADSESSAVREVDLRANQVRTLIGTGLFDFGDKDGDFSAAQLQHVLGVAALNDRQIFIADTYNHKVKLLNLSEQTIKTIIGNGSPGAGTEHERMLNEPGGLAVLDHTILIADTNNHRILQYNPTTKVLKDWPVSQE